MSIYKKLLSLAAVACILLLAGCGDNTVPEDTTPPPATTPDIPVGVVNDVVPGRFAVKDNKIYYALSDSILCYDETVSLVVTADEPSYLCLVGDILYFRCVSKRENYKPAEYQIRSVDLTNGSVAIYANGNINCLLTAQSKVFYLEDHSSLYKIENTSTQDILSGELSDPYAANGAIYLGIDGNLCRFDPSGEQYSVLIDKCYPNNISADEQTVYYSTEENSALSSYGIESGTVVQSSINNYGLVLDGGVHYYVVNNDGFALIRATDKHVVLELGRLQNCSSPLFYKGNIYFFISSDDYYGLISCDPLTGEMTRLTESEG
ncbi:MAG: hypothetical protein IKK58_00220 [Clostridia bacterium]|nr:hypothetical protein [Clostridia bacterium]